MKSPCWPRTRGREQATADRTESGIAMVTGMVQRRKLTTDVVANFPHLVAERVLQINRLLEIGPIFWPFFWYKIGQNRAEVRKSVQKDDRKGGFFATDFIKARQVRRLVSICNRRSLLPKLSGTARRCPGSPSEPDRGTRLMFWTLTGPDRFCAWQAFGSVAPSS
jgi:hypothetical protein